MRLVELVQDKIKTIDQAKAMIASWKVLGKKTAFTNGCFDILHPGHLFSLAQTAQEADYLIVGLNGDESIKRLKGPDRPIHNEVDRAHILANLLMVDMVVIFHEDTPLELINALIPDVLVKGGDYTLDTIIGAKEVIKHGGKVIINPLLEGYATTKIIEKIKK